MELVCIVASTPACLSGAAKPFTFQVANTLVLISHIFFDFANSHPHAIKECSEWLRRHLPHARIVEEASTSAGASKAAQDHTVLVGRVMWIYLMSIFWEAMTF